MLLRYGTEVLYLCVLSSFILSHHQIIQPLGSHLSQKGQSTIREKACLLGETHLLGTGDEGGGPGFEGGFGAERKGLQVEGRALGQCRASSRDTCSVKRTFVHSTYLI